MANKVVFITTTGTGTFTVPSDFGSLVSVEAIGGGGGSTGKGGSGGGAYAKSTTMTGLSAGLTTYYQVGAGSSSGNGTSSWFSLTNAAPTANLSSGTTGVLAAGGNGGAGAGTTTAGGTVANSTGDLRYAGGSGGNANGTGGGPGGGGAGGPGGAGGNGGDTSATTGLGGAGGGSGATLTVAGTAGTSTTSGQAGGVGGASAGQTGGTAGTSSGSNGGAGSNGGGGGGGYAGGQTRGGAGGAGTFWTQTSDGAIAGSGGGGGGGTGGAGSGGLYGGGGGGTGGAGAQGIIVFTYTPATKTVFITNTGSGTYKIPSDFVSLVSVEAIGAGGGGLKPASNTGGGAGAGGGAYSKSTTMTGLSAGITSYYSIGSGGTGGSGGTAASVVAGTDGGDTWFSLTNSAPAASSSGAAGVLAKGGKASTDNTTGVGAGGASSSGTGDVRNTGGNGGVGGGAGGTGRPAGGGGSAASNLGNGFDGGSAAAAGNSNAGGAGGGGVTSAGTAVASSTTGTNGGNTYSGSAGGAGGAQNNPGSDGTSGGGGGGSGSTSGGASVTGGAGGSGTEYTATAGGTAGSGGGGGGGGGATSGADNPNNGGAGGLYGGGGAGGGGSKTSGTVSGSGGAGAQGIIVFTYTYNAALYVNKTVFFTTTGAQTYRVPADFSSFVSVEAIGGGGQPTSNGSGGCGGGAYAKSTEITGLTAGQTLYINVGVPNITNTVSSATSLSWLNSASNVAPTSSTTGVKADCGLSSTASPTGRAGGLAANCVGTTVYSGGTGGDANSDNTGGGGGAGGPGGAGSNGGTGYATNATNAGGGGGGGAGGSSSTAGSVGTINGGGNGGAGPTGTAGGAGATSSTIAFAGTNGSGGGGGSRTNSSTYPGGNGSTYAYWTQTSDSAIAGPGGGGGGNSGAGAGTDAGNGGLYGGGAGGGGNSSGGTGGQGIVVFTYVAYLGAVYPSPKPPSNFQKDDPVYGKVDLDDTYVTDAWLLEKYVGNNLFTWGLGTSGGIGDNTTADKSSPVQIGRLSTWKQVATAGNTTGTFSLATKTDGTLWAWGGNSSGQIGNSTTVALSSPVQVGTLTNWKQVSVGRNIAAAIKTDNTLWTWGNNLVGALGGVAAGTGNTVDRSSPVQIGTAYSWKQVSAGGGASTQYTMAIGNDNSLWAIGGVNTLGGLGDGTTTTRSSPVQIGALDQWSSVSAGYQHTMAIQTDGTLWGWGDNTKGSLGTPSYYATSWSSPIQVGSLSSWSSIAVGPAVYATKTDGSLWYWGSQAIVYNNLFGDGTAAASSYSSPVQLGSLTDWSQVISNGSASMAIKTDGTLWGWGTNTSGNLGTSNITTYSSPIKVGTQTTWSKIASKTSTLSGTITVSTAAIKTDGTLWTWGNNASGQLGNGAGTGNTQTGSTTTRSSPVQVGSLSNWAQVDILTSNATQNDAICAAVKTDGTLWTWGFGPGGALGSGGTNGLNPANGGIITRSSPVQVGSLTNWSQVQVGRAGSTNNLFTMAIKTDNTLWAWGDNSLGQFGTGATSASISSPIQVGTLSDWSTVSVSSLNNLPVVAAIKTDGTLWTWGSNANGQLGIGSTATQVSSPTQVGTLTSWSKVSGHYGAVLAIKTDGSLWSSGSIVTGATGALGSVGTSLPDDRYYSSPIQIGQLTNWKAVAANYQYTLALKTDNTLWAWGNNALGNIGDGTTVDKQSPVQVGYLTDWKSLATISTSTAASPGAPSGAIKTDGTLWVWGVGTSGVLGDGTTVSKSSPTQIGLQTNWKQVALADALSGKGITFNDI